MLRSNCCSCNRTVPVLNPSFKSGFQIASFRGTWVKDSYSLERPAIQLQTPSVMQPTATEPGISVGEGTWNLASSCEIVQRERMSAGAVGVMRGDMQMYSEILGPRGGRLVAAWLTASPGLQALSYSCSGKYLFSNLISFTLMDGKGKSRQLLLCIFPGQSHGVLFTSTPCL